MTWAHENTPYFLQVGRWQGFLVTERATRTGMAPIPVTAQGKGLSKGGPRAPLPRGAPRPGRTSHGDPDHEAIEQRGVTITRRNDRWARHPWPIASEPSRSACELTVHAARPYLSSTWHSIERFLIQTRRQVGVRSSGVGLRQQRRVWNGHGAHNPAVLQRHLDADRIDCSECLSGKDGKAPAVRLRPHKVPTETEGAAEFPRNPEPNLDNR